ncbi:MAG: hypothetical protein HY905_03130 [Deltaproteobacteria bacterium]|nr:hypothetical protein [Deltaproteobacteria bacterium]
MRNGSWLTLVALLVAAAFAVPAAAQTPDSDACHMGADGYLVCGRIEIHGTLRNIVMVTFNREPLGIRLLELRQSFLQDILHSVEGDPF